MQRLAIGVLGPLELAVDGRPVPVPGARLRALLACLALHEGVPVSAEAIAAAVWPEDAPADPVAAVRSLVTRLRRLLPEGSITSVPGAYRLDADIDAHRFRLLATDGRFEEALSLWRGPALVDLPDEVVARAALEEQRITAVEDRARAELARGGGAEAVAELSELAVAHPFRERLHALLFRALRATGRSAEALSRYEELRRRLADELGADPGAELREVHLELLELEAPRRPRGNLRTALTSFVGRETESMRVRDALTSSRLVTLCGPGGVGKTRLATTVAAGLGGAWLVELASVTEPADVAMAVAQALGAFEIESPTPGHSTRFDGPTETIERLAATLGDQPALLVLDNCEHVIAAAAELAEELLGRCPELRIAATSREPLAITGETVCPIGPLSREAAVRLFTERAAAAGAGAGPGLDASMVAEVCDRLDGLPLAIELAAARLRTLPLDQFAARLDDRFRLLTGGSRTALPRHQTLRAVVAWSWDLLDADERALAEAASIFGGGLTIESAEWIGGTLETLTALADKSILSPTGTGRFQMLETLREFGRERLEVSGGLAKARAVHAAYSLDLAERAEPHLRGGDQLEWIARLDADHDNIIAALHHAAAGEDADTAVRLAAAMSMYWLIGGPRPEVTAWHEAALRTPGPAPDRVRLVAEGMCLINRMMCGTFQPDDVAEEFREIVAKAGPRPDEPLLALAEPLMLMFVDDNERSMERIEEHMSHPDPWVRAMLRMLRALLLEDRGEIADMRVDLRLAVEAFRSVGDRMGLEHSLMWLAQADLMFGEIDPAIAGLEESIRLQRELAPGNIAAHSRVILAGAHLVRGETARARAELESIIADAGEDGTDPYSPRQVLYAYIGLGDLARAEGRLDDAEAHYAAAARPVARPGVMPPQWAALIGRAQILLALARGDLDQARAGLADAVGHGLEALNMPVLAKVTVTAAALCDLESDPEGAAVWLGAAERLRGAPDRSDADAVALERALRSRIGAAAFESAHAAGRALDREVALERLDQLRRR